MNPIDPSRYVSSINIQAYTVKARPESANQRVQSTSMQSKKLPQVRPASAVVNKSRLPKRQTEEEAIQEELDIEDAFENYTKPGIDFNAIFLNPPSQHQDNKRLPKDIKKEKEKLYEEQMELKQQLNKIKEENVRVKTKNQLLQKENAKLEKLLENLDQYIQTGNGGHQPVSDHLLMNNLKKSLKELKGQIGDKDAELAVLKRHVKVTKIQEMETELKNYIEESIRLRSLLDQALRNQAAQKMAVQMDHLEEKFYVQMKVINSLQQEIEQFAGVVKLKEEELFNAQVRCEQYDGIRDKAEQQLETANQQLQEQHGKIEVLQQELINIKQINNNLIIRATKSHNDDMRIKDLENLNQEEKNTLEEKDREIQNLYKQLEDMKHNYQDSFNSLERERKQLENDMEYYKQQYEMVDEKYKNALLNHAQESLLEDPSKSDRKLRPSHPSVNRMYTAQIPMKEQDVMKSTSRPSVKVQSNAVKRRRTVKLEDVKDLGIELNMRFRLKKLKLEYVIEDDLFDIAIRSKGCVSIGDIAVRLSNSPFELKDVEKIYLLARYLIEDNTQDWVDYDEDMTSQFQMVRSIFKQLIGKYRIYTADEEQSMNNEISAQILKYKKSIQSYLPTFNTPLLTKDQITKAFNYMGVQIPNDALEYFFLKLFELQGENDVRKFDYRLITEEWGKEDIRKKTIDNKPPVRKDTLFKFTLDK